MFNKRKDVIIMDKHLTRFESPPKDTRPKYNKGDINMKWQEYNSDLRKLWNTIVDSYSETNSSKIVEKANKEVNRLMERLTIELSEISEIEGENK